MIIQDSRVCGLTTNFKALLVSPYWGAFLLFFRRQLLSFSQPDDLWGWQICYRPCNFIKTGRVLTPARVFSWKLSKIFWTDIFYVTPLDTASEFIQDSHSFCPFLPGLLVCWDKEEEKGWPIQDFELKVLLANNVLRI